MKFVRVVGLVAGLLLVAGPAVAEPVASVPAEPLFSRHVIPLFSRLGCNAGACHGAVQGQGGFRLTLFGAEPALDHDRLLHEYGGRRLNLVDPSSSLLLQKAAGRVPHQGGRRTSPDSPEFAILQKWIEQGAHRDDLDRSRLSQLRVTPLQRTLQPGERYSLKVEATFADGSTEDVTGLCTFEAADKDVASVNGSGLVEARGPGDTALVVRYRAEPVVAQVMVPRPGEEPFPPVQPVNFVDRHVLDKLRALNVHPSELADDATFLRRASLDVTGELPQPEEIRAFLADQTPDKRARKIEELLSRPGHATVWATRLCDILKPVGYSSNYGFTEPADARRFYEWLRARLVENVPYDQLVERILTATSREGRSADDWIREIHQIAEEDAGDGPQLTAYSQRKTLDLYWQRDGATGVKGTVQVAHAFLGLRLECAQCHRHPHDVWQQDDLLSFSNFFLRISNAGYNGSSPEVARAADPLAAQGKQLRDEAKKLGDRAKDKKLSKEEADRLQAEANALSRKARALETAGKRLKGTEIHTNVKAGTASVSSPLGTQKSDRLRLLGEPRAITVPAEQDPRAVVVEWMRRPDNPFFARAIVNRIWAHYFGRGIVDPPDHLSPLNPPTHPELLRELADGLVQNRFDLRWVHRAILNSRTYQTSSRTNPRNAHDTKNYAFFVKRRLSAELLVDAINHATGGSETFPADLRLPPGARAIELAGDMKADPRDARATALAYALQIFGRPPRNPEVQCDCERDRAPTIVQMLYLASHPAVREKIAAPQGRPAQVLQQFDNNAQRIDELFLWTVARPPTEAEKQKCLDYLQGSPSPQKGLEGLMWTLMNTREFLLIH
jgi:hypothetical protein